LPSRSPRLRLEDIIEDVSRIERYTVGMLRDHFMGDEKTQDSVLHCLLRISEAAKKLQGND
jgi:uncharacterized protein with HEPN domain